MQTVIPTLQENIFDVHHIGDFAMNVWQWAIWLLQIYPIVQAWYSNACIILLLILIHFMQHAMLYSW